MKIAQVCPRYYPDIGGVEAHVQEISERLVKRGFDVEVVCTDPDGSLHNHEIINSVKVTRFKSFAPNEAYYFAPQVYSYLKNQEYDLLHAHSYHALPALFAMLAKNGRWFIFTPHYHREGHTFTRNLLHKPYKYFGSRIFGKADKVICVSEYEKKNIISDFGIPAEKIEKIPNGLNLVEFTDLKYNKKQSIERTLLYVGRLEEYKGIQHIIKTLPYIENFKLEIIGKGPYEKDLQRLAERLKISKRINWVRNITREELLRYYASADVFLMLSTHEAYGITVAEALAAGVPCIVAMGSALEEFVDGEQCRGIEMPITTDELVRAIRQLTDGGTDVNKKIKKIKNNQLYDWNDITDRLIKTYRSLQ